MSEELSTHFRPAGRFVGDVIPFEHNGTAWLYYLLDERPDLLTSFIECRWPLRLLPDN